MTTEMATDLEQPTRTVPQFLISSDALAVLYASGIEFRGLRDEIELLDRQASPTYSPAFTMPEYTAMTKRSARTNTLSHQANVKIYISGEERLDVDEGDGVINALDKAMRKSLVQRYPELSSLKLKDYGVKIERPSEASASPVQVIITSECTENGHAGTITTIGVSTDIIEASALALTKNFELYLQRRKDKNHGAGSPPG